MVAYCTQPELSEVLLWKGKGLVFTHWGGLCHGRRVYNNMVTNGYNNMVSSNMVLEITDLYKCLQSMYPLLSRSVPF